MNAVSSPESVRMVFRLLRPEDAAALRRLRVQAISECAHHFGTPPEVEARRSPAYYRRRILQGRRRGGEAIVGGWVEEDLAAMAGIRRSRTASGTVGLITGMYVDPSWRGRGVGGALLRQCVERVDRLWRLSVCQMNVEVSNRPALDLYLRAGFRVLGREDNAFTLGGTPYAVYLLENSPETPE